MPGIFFYLISHITFIKKAVTSPVLTFYNFSHFFGRFLTAIFQPHFNNTYYPAFEKLHAVLFAVISIVVYIAALMCSHMSAFRVAANVRKELMRHITALPLGVTEKYGSGKLRRIVNTSSTATETCLAHRLPDKAGAVATPIGLLFLLFVFDWRLGLLSLVPVVPGFLIMMKMTGKDMEQRMEQYQNALSDMSNEAVEYVRGVPVVKTFGQTIFSFKRFKDAIDNYETWVIAYTKGLRLPMMFYTTAINGVFAFLIAGGIIFTRGGVTNELLLNLIFYIVITPVIGTTLTKIMFMSEDTMIVNDAISRIDEVLNEKPLSESGVNNIPKDNGVVLEQFKDECYEQRYYKRSNTAPIWRAWDAVQRKRHSYLLFAFCSGRCTAWNRVSCHCLGGQGRIPGDRGICMDTLAGSKHNPF